MSTSQMPPQHSPAAEFFIDEMLVKNLLAAQQPDLAQLPIQALDEGWDNAMFRLGENFAVRLPRRQSAAQLIAHEQNWLPQIAPQISLPIPLPVRVGLPAPNYPWRWSVLPWLPGTTANSAVPHENQAQRFGQFLRKLHTLAPANAPSNEFRGVPLAQRAADITARLQRLSQKTDLITKQIWQCWEQALAAPVTTARNWLHGDLHARNVLVENGVITGIIDWGDLTAGDVATDLAALWMLFASRRAREAAWQAYGANATATQQRAQGWAIVFGAVLLETGLHDHPRHALMGEKILQRLQA